MKSLILISILCLTTVQISYALEAKYAVHTSANDIESKKKNALEWYEHNLNSQRYNWYESNTRNTTWLKDRAFRWYENNIVKGKFYFVNSNKETTLTKNKALRWYDRNSSIPSVKKNNS